MDRQFIADEVNHLLKEKIIEPSFSPWRAQVVVVKHNGKMRLCIDYSETVNKYTVPDAYPIPVIEELVNEMAQYKYFSSLDLASAYHQVALDPKDRPLTAFEANSRLFQFTCLSFGLTNGATCFQRVIDELVDRYKLRATFPYLDDITVCGMTEKEHDDNVTRMLEIAKMHGITLNSEKCKFKQTSIKILGYEVSQNCIKPDPDRLQALFNIKLPTTKKELDWLLGMLAYYSKWIANFSEKIVPLKNAFLPFSHSAQVAFKDIIQELAEASKGRIDPNKHFTIETDASQNAIAATLTQDDKPVAFFSHTLSKSGKGALFY